MNKILFFVMTLLASFTTSAQEENPFVFKDGNQVIRLEFESNLPYLELNKPTKMTVYADNVKREETAVVGRGIRLVPTDGKYSYSFWTVTVDKESIIDGKYKIIVRYGYKPDDSMKICTFFVPVKI